METIVHSKIIYGWRRDNTPIYVECGQWAGGEKQLCDDCIARAEKRYPQGWRYYPGDVCKHGTYVGGSGADLMCHYCELGEEE